jgi:hypothetical protein
VSRDTDLQHVLTRLENLERHNRWLKGGLLALATALGLALLAAAQEAPRPKTVEAERFIVVDGDGKTVATLGMDQGRPTLALYQGATPRVQIYADKKSSALAFDEDKGRRLGLVAGPGKTAGFVLYPTPGEIKEQISLFYSDDGKPALFFNDARGKSRIGLSLRPDGKPGFTLSDENGRTFYSQFQR